MNKLFENDISLDQENHRYILTENPNFEFESVTQFIHHFFEKFDQENVARKLINTHPKYAGKTVEQVIKKWNKGAIKGTIVHNELEAFIKEGIFPEHQMSIVGANWLNEKKKNKSNKFFSEVIVYSKQLGIAGTIDLLVYNEEQNMYHLVDWKTNKKIEKSSFNDKKGILQSSNHIDDCNFMHYSLQLSFYRYILERFYGLEVGSQTLIHLKDDSFDIHSIDYLNQDLINMLREKDLI